MNECFFIGRIIEGIKYDFILNGKNDAISRFKVKLMDGETINVVSYNKNADYCYRVLEDNDVVFIYARLGSFKEHTRLEDCKEYLKLSNCKESVELKNVKRQLSVIAERICKLN